jgi:hypothetical protein
VRLRVEVTDQYGMVAEVFDPEELLARLKPRQRAKLSALADGLVRDLAEKLGGGQEHARAVAVAYLMRLQSDAAAYEREAERRGLLPL